VMIDALAVAKEIVAAAKRIDRPLLTCFMGKHAAQESVSFLRGSGVPVYAFPESAAQALAAMAQYRRLLERPEPTSERLPVDRATAGRILRRAAAARRETLEPSEAEGLLRAYGIQFAPSRLVARRADAIDAAHSLGYPVVLKGTAPGLVHKSDIGGVRTDLRNADEVAAAFDAIQAALRKVAGARVQVQAMVKGGREVILGSFKDAAFGTILMFGLGGVFVEYLKDVSFGLTPLHRAEAERMIRTLRAYPLLRGARGREPVAIDVLVEALLRLSQLVDDFPQIEQVDVNPLMACPAPEPSLAVDVRVRLTRDGTV